MPLNLSEYTPRIRDSLKRGGFACVYVVSTPDGKPSRIAFAVNLWQAVAEMQRLCPVAIWVQDVLWVPDRTIAGGIAKMTQASFAGQLLHGGWLDVDHGKVVMEMQIKAATMYPNATMLGHEHLIAESRRNRVKEAV